MANRTTTERIESAVRRFASEPNVWVATGSMAGTPHLVPLSLAWNGTDMLAASSAVRRAGRMGSARRTRSVVDADPFSTPDSGVEQRRRVEGSNHHARRLLADRPIMSTLAHPVASRPAMGGRVVNRWSEESDRDGVAHLFSRQSGRSAWTRSLRAARYEVPHSTAMIWSVRMERTSPVRRP
jgi:hypothetical protein